MIMKKEQFFFGAAASAVLLWCCATTMMMILPGLAAAADANAVPSLEETFAWIKQLDGNITKPKYANLTFEQLRTMTDLQIGGHRKSDKKHISVPLEDFRHLAALPALTKLHLGENDGATDEAMVYVGKLTGLKELILWDSPLTDAGFKHLTNLKELRTLDLAFATKVTTAALADIVQLPNLENLTIPGTKIDDVSPLAKAPKLKMLKVGKLTPGGIDALKKAKPDLQIQ